MSDFPAPAAEMSEKAWVATLERLVSGYDRLLDAAATLPDSILEQKIKGKDYFVSLFAARSNQP